MYSGNQRSRNLVQNRGPEKETARVLIVDTFENVYNEKFVSIYVMIMYKIFRNEHTCTAGTRLQNRLVQEKILPSFHVFKTRVYRTRKAEVVSVYNIV